MFVIFHSTHERRKYIGNDYKYIIMFNADHNVYLCIHWAIEGKVVMGE